MTIAFFPPRLWRMVLSSPSRGDEPSMTARMRSAFSMDARARSIPICSTLLSVSRRPAVSIRRRETPDMRTASSMVSRVVPGTSVTIARSSCRRAFSRDDFPAFGLPIIAVRSPSLIIRPSSDRFRSADRDLSIFSKASLISSMVRSSRSSSG